jgi:hypothetical protein
MSDANQPPEGSSVDLDAPSGPTGDNVTERLSQVAREIGGRDDVRMDANPGGCGSKKPGDGDGDDDDDGGDGGESQG